MSEDDLTIPEELFDPEFEEYHEALKQLRRVLLNVGFHIYEKKEKDGTLQVYLGKRVKYPLLNPRFVLVPDDEGAAELKEGDPVTAGITVAVLSKGDQPDLDTTLLKFSPNDDVRFQPAEARHRKSGDFVFHGGFLIFVPFVPGSNPAEIDFDALAEPFQQIHSHLS